MKKLTQKRLKEVLAYDPETGVFTWKINRGCKKKGEIAGCLNGHGYRQIMVDGESSKAHQLALLFTDGYFPENDVDHKNRKKDDNRRKNLRHTSRRCNILNCKTRKDNSSEITGISWHKREKRKEVAGPHTGFWETVKFRVVRFKIGSSGGKMDGRKRV